jgi:chemotaxis signal transduction protein
LTAAQVLIIIVWRTALGKPLTELHGVAVRLDEVPEIETQVNAEYIQGVYRKEDSLTVLLDVAKVLDLKDKKVLNSGKVAA